MRSLGFWVIMFIFGPACCLASENLNFDGFATVGWVYSDGNAASWEGMPEDYTSFSTDTRIGGQLTWQASPSLSLTAQAIAWAEEDFEPELTWAYLNYQVSDSLAVRFGRQQAPIFMISDYISVGYGYLWARPPFEAYWQIPNNNFDGINSIYRTSLGDWDFTSQLAYGRTEAEIVHTQMTAWGINLDVTNREFRVGLSYFDVSLDIDLSDSFGSSIAATAQQLAMLNPLLGSLPQETINSWLIVDDGAGSFLAFSLGYDANNVVFSGEFTQREVPGFNVTSEAWYITAGYRFGAVTPYVVISKTRCPDYDQNLPVPTTPMEQAVLSIYNPIFRGLFENNQQSKAIGVRYDWNDYSALKVEYKRVDTQGTKGTYRTEFPANDGKVQIFTVLVDFVF